MLAGEELTVPYCSGYLPYTLRQQMLTTRLDRGFTCRCARCAYTQEHPEHAALEQEVEEYLTGGLVAADSAYASAQRTDLVRRLQDLPASDPAGGGGDRGQWCAAEVCAATPEPPSQEYGYGDNNRVKK